MFDMVLSLHVKLADLAGPLPRTVSGVVAFSAFMVSSCYSGNQITIRCGRMAATWSGPSTDKVTYTRCCG